MSMPFLEFSCRRCGFTGTDTVTWGRYSYLATNTLVPINRQLGWCNRCAGLVAVEILPTNERLKAMTEEITSARRNQDRRHEREKENRPWFKKFIRIHHMSPEFQEAEFQIGCREDALKKEQLRHSALSTRVSKSKCLSCGSEESFPFPEGVRAAGTYDDPAPAVPSGVKHPICGDELLVKHSDIWANVALTHRLYDLEGRLIRVEENEARYTAPASFLRNSRSSP